MARYVCDCRYLSVVYEHSGEFRHRNHSISFVLVFPNVAPCQLLSPDDRNCHGQQLPKGEVHVG